jgi:hypothetical protein
MHSKNIMSEDLAHAQTRLPAYQKNCSKQSQNIFQNVLEEVRQLQYRIIVIIIKISSQCTLNRCYWFQLQTVFPCASVSLLSFNFLCFLSRRKFG